MRVTNTPDGKSLIVYNSDTIDTLKREDNGKLVVEHTLKIGEKTDASVLIAASDEHIVIGREGQPLSIYDRSLQQTAVTVAIPGNVDPRQIQSIGQSDRFSVVDHDNRLWIVDPTAKTISQANCPNQGAITGISWMSDDEAWVGVRPNIAIQWNMSTGQVVRRLEPTQSRLEFFYSYIARPLYIVSPKPSSLNGVLQKLLQRDRAGQTQLFNNDLAAFRVEVEVWQPIISNLIFVAVLLGIGCLYVWRKEF